MKVIMLQIFCMVILCACDQLPLEDSSDNERFMAVIGKEFRFLEDVLAIGITADRNYLQKVDYIELVPIPGFIGPEVVFSEKFPEGSIIRVVGVLTSKVFYTNRVIFIVEDLGSTKYENYQIRLIVKGDVGGKNFGLDEKVLTESMGSDSIDYHQK